MTLADRIEKRIRRIPASNPAYISFVPKTLGNVLDAELLRFIALEAANVADEWYGKPPVTP